MTASLRHLISRIETRIVLGWATAAEKQEYKRLLAEEKRQLDSYFEAMAWERARQESIRPKPITKPSWIKDMGMDDFIRGRRVVTEREDYAEQKERVSRQTKLP